MLIFGCISVLFIKDFPVILYEPEIFRCVFVVFFSHEFLLDFVIALSFSVYSNYTLFLFIPWLISKHSKRTMWVPELHLCWGTYCSFRQFSLSVINFYATECTSHASLLGRMVECFVNGGLESISKNKRSILFSRLSVSCLSVLRLIRARSYVAKG